MRSIIPVILILAAMGIFGLSSCDGESTAVGDLKVQIELQGDLYVARHPGAVDRLCSLITPRSAHAFADMGFSPNSYPYNQFTGDRPVEGGLNVNVTARDKTLIAHAVTGTSGRADFTGINTGYLTLVLTGADSSNYFVPVEVSANTTSRTRVIIYRDQTDGTIRFRAKTIHDYDGDGINDDDFSYALYNRRRNQSAGGSIHLHSGNETRIDYNGDGDYIDADDRDVVEPDDDGIASDDGDGDEDNDGILDENDDDIDGDGILNDVDQDMDGDGVANNDDTYPDGITPNDDFSPPTLTGGDPYPGIINLIAFDEDTVSVFFPVAVDEMNEPVTYIIYYSTTSPMDFDSAYNQTFRPVGDVSGDDDLTDNATVPVTGQTWYFAVRVVDSAQPPNEDENIAEMEIEL